MTRLALLAGFLLVPLEAQAQIDSTQVGACAPARAEAFLDVGNVRARILNDGSLFSRGDGGGYEVPKGNGRHAMYAAALWVAGRVLDVEDGTPTDTLAAASTYGPYEFWPGPLAADGSPPAECTPYDRLYSVYRADVEHYDATGQATADLRDWPHDLGAPVVDGDGDPSNYALTGGDRPALLGDQMVWWVMNDAGNVHRRTESRPLGLEVQGTAFAFDAPGVLGLTTFYRYRLRYRGRGPLDDAYVGFWADPDVGYAGDDAFGADLGLDLVYAFNATPADGARVPGAAPFAYASPPPGVGVALLQGPRAGEDPAERAGLHAVHCQPDLPYRTVTPVQLVYYYVQGLSANGRAYPSGFCTSLGPAYGIDIRFLLSAGPFRLDPGEEDEIVFAVVWARGETHLDAPGLLKAAVDVLGDRIDAILTPFSAATLVAAEAPAPDGPALDVLAYPNPFTDRTTIRYRLSREAAVRLAVYDVLGREVARLADERQPAGRHDAGFDGSALPAGLYVARLQAGGRIRTTTLLHTR